MSTKPTLIISHIGLLFAIVGGTLVRHSDVLYGHHPDLLLAGIGSGLGLIGLVAGVWACIDAANTAGRSAWHGLWGVTWAGPVAVWALTRPVRRWWHPWLPVAVLTMVVLVTGIAMWPGNAPEDELPPFPIVTPSQPPEEPPPVGMPMLPPPSKSPAP